MNRLAILLIGFIFSQGIQAQTRKLTLKDAIQYALENKADAKKAKLKVEN
ncbi:MAG: transporter, partial [Flavobacteriaceae bacterium]